MRRRSVAIPILAVGLLAIGMSSALAAPPDLVAGGKHGIVYARGHARPGGGGNTQLVWHKGQIMTSSEVTAIYWGPNWSTADYPGDKITGLESLYGGFGGSNYMGTNTEYTGTNGQVTTAVAYKGDAIDTLPTSSSAPSTSDVLAVVARNIASPIANGYYPVYSDQKRGGAGYCAWHSYGTISTATGPVPVQFAFFFDLTGDTGCTPQGTATGPGQPLIALANVSGHELSEAVTDPRNGGWWDRSGAENADKCAWTFKGTVTLSNRTVWQIQENWSNRVRGCIQGN